MGSQQPQAVSLPMTGKGLLSFGSLARQGSIYSLTLDEFQNSIPDMKNFGSMNMDEFLKNIWTAEEQQAMQAVMTNTSTEGQAPAGEGPASQPGLQSQPSLTLPGMLSRKTVDEVWRDIHGNGEGAENTGPGEQQRSATFGEMTLEDFLVRAGVVREDLDTVGAPFGSGSFGAGGAENGGGGERDGGAAERDVGAVHPALTLLPANAVDAMQLDAFKQQQAQAQWLNDQYRNAQQQQAHVIAAQQQAEAVAYVNAAKRMGNGALAAGLGPLADGYAGGLGIGLGAAAGLSNLALGPGSPNGGISDGMLPGGNGLALSPMGGGFGFDPLRSRKRVSDGPVEKVVERRQRRMIKNRESAARSRARKQAYTVELEAEVTQLKEENLRLRKLQEEEVKKKQMIESMIAQAQQSSPNSRAVTLRRTQSAHVSIAIS